VQPPQHPEQRPADGDENQEHAGTNQQQDAVAVGGARRKHRAHRRHDQGVRLKRREPVTEVLELDGRLVAGGRSGGAAPAAA
jgi:hypothetical protein